MIKQKKLYTITKSDMANKRRKHKWHYGFSYREGLSFSADIIGCQSSDGQPMRSIGIGSHCYNINSREHYYDKERE